MLKKAVLPQLGEPDIAIDLHIERRMPGFDEVRFQTPAMFDFGDSKDRLVSTEDGLFMLSIRVATSGPHGTVMGTLHPLMSRSDWN